MKTVPVFWKGSSALQTRLDEICCGIDVSPIRQTRRWELLMLLPRMLLATTRWAHQQGEVSSPVGGFLAWSVAEVDWDDSVLRKLPQRCPGNAAAPTRSRT